MKYRRKASDVEAVHIPRLMADDDPARFGLTVKEDIPKVLQNALKEERVVPIFGWENSQAWNYSVAQRGRAVIAHPGDWLLFDSMGDIYVILDSQFRHNYEPVDNSGGRIPPYTHTQRPN